MKWALTLTLFLYIVSPQVLASQVMEFTVGANYGQIKPKGLIGGASDSTLSLLETKESFDEVYLLFEHPFPLIPNVKLVSSNFEHEFTADLTQTFSVGEQYYRVASALSAHYQYEKMDYIFFYEVFDNQVLELDAGLVIRDSGATLSVINLDEVNQASSQNGNRVDAMLYGLGQFNLPLLDLSFFATTNYLDGNNYDAQVAIEYQLRMVPMLTPFVQFGFKTHKTESDNLDGMFLQQEWETTYLGFGFSF